MLRKTIIALGILLNFLIVFAFIPAHSFAWMVKKPVMKEGKIVGYEDIEIPDDRVPLGVPEGAVGYMGFDDVNFANSIDPIKCGIDTSDNSTLYGKLIGEYTKPKGVKLGGPWTAYDYFQFQCSYHGMEVYPIKDYVGDLQLDLIDKVGRMRTRKLFQWRKPFYGEGGIRYKNMVSFFYPPDVKGLSNLTVKHCDPEMADDLWVYLPALRRVRRISAAQRLDSFGGSDITYDQVDRSTNLWDVKITGECDMVPGKDPVYDYYGAKEHARWFSHEPHCVIIEVVPKKKAWPISKILMYMSKKGAKWYMENTYDKAGRLMKTFLPYLEHSYPANPRYWNFGNYYAHELRTDHKSIIYLPDIDKMGYKVLDYKKGDWSNYCQWFDVGYSNDFLSQRYMMRGVR